MSKYKSTQSKRLTTTSEKTNARTNNRKDDKSKKSDSSLAPPLLSQGERKRKNVVVQKDDETTITNDSNDWITLLTKKIVANDDVATSKTDRIATRVAKRQRKLINHAQQQDSAMSSSPSTSSSSKVERMNKKNQQMEEQKQQQISIMKHRTQSQLQTISEFINNLVTIQRTNNPKWKKQLFQPNPSLYTTTKSNILKGSNTDIIKNIQPRTNDYGGIGLARQSLFISLNDPSYIPQLEKEFNEHISGFFGKKHKSKLMKKHLSQTMLWKQLQNNKKIIKTKSNTNTNTTATIKSIKNDDNYELDNEDISQKKQNLSKNKKKISKMTADERVELLLKTNSKII